MLENRIGLVVGVANEHSIATGCARAFAREGATLAMTYVNDRALPHVQPVADEVGAAELMPLDLSVPSQIDAVFDTIAQRWGRLDFLLHSVAYCPKEDLHGRVVDCSADGFAQAMDISCHSFPRLVRKAEPLMLDGGSLLTVSYYGAEKVVDNYNIMGPVKAALEAVTREVATELGPQGIRANVLSPGPIATRAASGIEHFDALMQDAREHAAQKRLVTIDEVGETAAFLASDRASGVTGSICYIDGGRHARI
ncbi:enoyl-ACP reductase FabI [Roseovarius sp. D22-M7]